MRFLKRAAAAAYVGLLACIAACATGAGATGAGAAAKAGLSPKPSPSRSPSTSTSGGPQEPETAAAPNVKLVPFRQAGACDSDAGAPAPEVLTPNRTCRTLDDEDASRPDRQHTASVELAASAEAFSSRYGCPPPARADFSRQRVAVLGLQHMSNQHLVVLGVREDAGRATIRVMKATGCGGHAPERQSATFVVALPASNASVEVEECTVSTPRCGPEP
jgi:hypothetical protein